MTRKDRIRLSIFGVVSFMLFAVVLDYLAHRFNVPHRAWAPGVAVGLAGAVVLILRRGLRREVDQHPEG